MYCDIMCACRSRFFRDMQSLDYFPFLEAGFGRLLRQLGEFKSSIDDWISGEGRTACGKGRPEREGEVGRGRTLYTSRP